MPRTEKQRHQEEADLLKAVATHLPELKTLLERCSQGWDYEDPIYRFYHQSFKVYDLQQTTEEIVSKLQALAPHLEMNDWFLDIVQEGTGKKFSMDDNEDWTATTRPIVEAFFHARYMLEMVCKYGTKLKEPPSTIPSGWAAVLYLYDLR